MAMTKAYVLRILREANGINTPTLNTHFNTVWVGEEMKQRITTAQRRLTHNAR